MSQVVATFEKVSRETYERYIINSNLPRDAFVAYEDIKLPTRATKRSAGYDFYSPVEFDYMRDSVEIDVYKDSKRAFHVNGYREVVIFQNQRHIFLPTFVKCNMKVSENDDRDWVLLMMPKCGDAMKTGIRLTNTIGVIDADYYNNPDNEGHIQLDITYGHPLTQYNYDKENQVTDAFEIHVQKNQKLVQGIFTEYGIATNGNLEYDRKGGFGSTGII